MGAIVFSIVEVYLPSSDLLDDNLQALEKVPCTDQGCDTTALANDFYFNGPDYLIDKKTNFLLNFSPPKNFRFPLNRSDVSFIARFKEPQTYTSPAGETWRLASLERTVGKRRLAVIVAYGDNVTWRIKVPVSSFAGIDQQLETQLAKIANGLNENADEIAEVLLPNDGYEIVDEATGEIRAGGYWLPVFLPANMTYPPRGIGFARSGKKLYLVRTTEAGRLIAVSTYLIGEWTTLTIIFAFVFLAVALLAYIAALTILRRFLTFRETTPVALEEALKHSS